MDFRLPRRCVDIFAVLDCYAVYIGSYIQTIRDKLLVQSWRVNRLLKNKRPTWCHLLFYFTSYVQVESCNTDTTPNQPHRNSNTHRTKNNATNVVIQQNSRKPLMMDILMSETCWAHKKWNKIASDIKLVFYTSTITMMHGPINIRNTTYINQQLLKVKILATCFSYSEPSSGQKRNRVLVHSVIVHSMGSHRACFSTFVRPRPGKFFFHTTRARPQQIYS